MAEQVDVTPHPRILRTLGEIPFAAWQCIAELVDNSLDGFRKQSESSTPDEEQRIVVSWSGDGVAEEDRALEVRDTGPGMPLDVLQQCVKAGYSSNDPVSYLGLFGMGFNIATARLGDRTLVLSAEVGSPEWVGVEIDFDNLIKSVKYGAPVVRLPKQSPNEHGTHIRISRIKPGLFKELQGRGREIRKQLEVIYSPILSQSRIEMLIQGIQLQPVRPCIWSPSRYVNHKGEKVNAYVPIDENLGVALFNANHNRYVTTSEDAECRKCYDQTGRYPEGIITRVKRVYGWLGVQRYADPEDFGIDFVRNGRKILIGDKSLFSFRNPMTGRITLEYPRELGVTVGGRIIGEIHVDHVPPTYQKTDFDRTDDSWEEMLICLRGEGPILPRARKNLEYTGENTSPLGRLISAYMEIDKGTRHLSVPNDKARKWAQKFRDGDPDYETDEKWWQSAIEVDRKAADKGAEESSEVDSGDSASEDVTQYGPVGQQGSGAAVSEQTSPSEPPLSEIEDLRRRSKKLEIHSDDYIFAQGGSPFKVNVWELKNGQIGPESQAKPVKWFAESVNCDFFFDPRHPFLLHFPIDFRDLLLIYLADRFNIRNKVDDIAAVFSSLYETNFPDVRIEHQRIQKEARLLFNRLREAAVQLLTVREQEVIEFVFESAGEVEDTMPNLIANPKLVSRFQSQAPGCIEALLSVPYRTLVRLVERFPEEFFDGSFFTSAYKVIDLPDAKSTERLRSLSKERILSYLKDALWSISEHRLPVSEQRLKEELQRCEHSLRFLAQEDR